MLDAEQQPPEEMADDLPEGDAALDAIADIEEAPAELVITIGDDAPEDDEEEIDETGLEEKQVSTLRTLRNRLKEQAREAREAKRVAAEAAAKLAAIEAASKPRLQEKPMPMPVEYGYDDELYRKAVLDWRAHDDAVKHQQAREREEAARQEEALAAKARAYAEGKRALRVANYDAAEQVVIADLTIDQQRTILEYAADPAKLVYALGQSHKARQELASIKDPRQFAYRLGQMERDIKVQERKPPPVETRLKGGNGAGAVVGGSWATRIASAEKKAERDGDWTEVIRIKKQARAAGAKV